MSALLCSTAEALHDCLANQGVSAPLALLGAGNVALAGVPPAMLPSLLRVSWPAPDLVDALRRYATVIVDIDAATLSLTQHQQLATDIGALAEQERTLIFAPAAVSLAGISEPDGTTPVALPNTRVMAALPAVLDPGVYSRPRAAVLRLLALDGSVCVRYSPSPPAITVHGGGSVLIVAFGPGRSRRSGHRRHQRADRRHDTDMVDQMVTQ